MKWTGSVVVVGGLVLGLAAGVSVGPFAQSSAGSADVILQPTIHPHLPSEPSQLWMVPPAARGPDNAALTEFATAVKLEVDGNFSKALRMLSPSLLRDGPLADYVIYYRGLAQLRTGLAEDARRTFKALGASKPVGFLSEAAALSEAEADEALGDKRAALTIYERVSKTESTAPDEVLMRLGRAARAVGDLGAALRAFSLVYYEFPFSDLAPVADLELDHLPNRAPIAAGTNRFKLELGRAQQLFSSKRYVLAREAFDGLQGAAEGDDRELVSLRLAECDYYLKRLRDARDGAKPYVVRARRQGEALFFYAIALRDLGQVDEYVRLVRRLADDFPTETWSEEGLDGLATYYILQNDDAKANETFREIYERFPQGHNAERAAWKIGWQSYRSGQYAETIRVFESAAASFSRSDLRPPWLYWAARAHEALNETGLAEARYRLVAADYRNSYYGRLALTHLNGVVLPRRLIDDGRALGEPEPVGAGSNGPAPLPANQHTIRALLSLGLYDQALDELHYAQKVWGDSSSIGATLAWIYERQGRTETGERQFSLYRNAINTMKRAYPQFLAAGGEELPADLLRVIFPIGYWDLIRKRAAEYKLDPYLIAALVAQESTFVPDIVSYAKAVGLMQLEAATARQYARKLGMRYSSNLRTNPDASIRIGMEKLADDIKQFGQIHLVLASYNAGPGAVRRWVADRPGLPRDEFIDDIPYPQTQGYVKKILGTAEDYRRLYGPDAVAADSADQAPVVAATPASPVTHATPRASSASKTKKRPAGATHKPRKRA